MVAATAFILYRGLKDRRELSPFLASLGLFVLAYVGIGISFYPYIVPGSITIWEAASPDNSLAFLLVGASVLIPIILAYTAYSYWVFRGKVNVVAGGYH
jgi:cytochrome d ubiquinol oxidase subunit II